MVALCEEMGQVEGSFPPMNLKLILLNPISNPMKSYVYRFWAALFDCGGGQSYSKGIVA